MKNRLDYMDSPSREQYLHKICNADNIEVLNSDYSSLFTELMKKSEDILIPCADGNSYSFAELMRYQPLVVLEEIKALPQKIQDHLLHQQILQWEERLHSFTDLKLSQVISNLIREEVPAYECLTVLQSGYSEFREEIETCGIVDPSLALFDSFLNNYSFIASHFNDLWKRLGEFYVLNVLHRRPYKPSPDKTWLLLEKREDSHDLLIPANTEFVAGAHPDGSDFCYKSTEATTVGHMKLRSASSIMLQRQNILVDEEPVNYVKTILKKKITQEAYSNPTILFDPNAERDADHQFITTGIMIESPMFILEEGFRVITINFFLTPDSLEPFHRYADKITRESYKGEGSIYARLLKTAFYLEISTEEGWTNIPVYDILFVNEAGKEKISISLRLDYNFPTPVPCGSQHGAFTDMPSLRVLINRDAPRFPYTWAREMYFSHVTIQNEVSGVTSLELLNEQGQQDAHSSFQPFGTQGEKGNWMIVGNYEMSLKPLTEVKLLCKWLQQPEGGNLKYHYADYGKQIDNSTFRIKTEFLKDKKWVGSPEGISSLFSTNYQDGTMLPQSTVTWTLNGKMPVGKYDPFNYRYGVSTSGFLRMVLSEPDYGFGTSVYQHLYINSLIRRGNKD